MDTWHTHLLFYFSIPILSVPPHRLARMLGSCSAYSLVAPVVSRGVSCGPASTGHSLSPY